MKKRLFFMLIVNLLLMTIASAGSYQKEEIKLVINGAKVTLTSSETLLHDGKPTRYSVANLADGDLQTAWVTRYTPNLYVSQGRLTIEFEKPIYIKTLKIANGYQKNKETYQENQRVKWLNVFSFMESSGFDEGDVLELKDQQGWQEFNIAHPLEIFATKFIVMDIFEAYSGTKYQDVCISEISFTYSEESPYKPSQSWESLKDKIMSNRTVSERGWDWEKMTSSLASDATDWNDFLYYVLSGKKDAYDLFITLYPEDTMMSEMMQADYIPNVNAQLGISNDKE